MSVRMLAAAITTLSIVSINKLAVAQDVKPAHASNDDFTRLDMNTLIDRLPMVGAEGRYDRDLQRWVSDPAVDEMRRRMSEGQPLTQEQWQRALTRTGIITVRDKWPAKTPIIVAMQDSRWLPATEIRLKPQLASLKPLTGGVLFAERCGTAASRREREQMNQLLGKLPLGIRHVVFDAEIEKGKNWVSDEGPRAGMLWKGELAFDIDVVPSLKEAMPPISTTAANNAVRTSLGVCTRPWGEKDALATLLVFDADTKSSACLTEMAVSMTVKLVRDGKVEEETKIVVHRYDSLLSGNSVYTGPIQLFSFARLEKFPATRIADKAELKRWSIQVKASDDDILKLWHAKTRWAGSFEMPLAEAVDQEAARTKGNGPRSFIWMP